MTMHIIDRRLNPSGKSLANRQRFLRRAKALVRRRGARRLGRTATSRTSTQGGEVVDPGRRRPRAAASGASATGGMRDHVLPGNKEYLEGDDDPARPSGGGGGGSEGSPDGEGEDEFRFVAVARRVPRPVPRGPRAARPRQAPRC